MIQLVPYNGAVAPADWLHYAAEPTPQRPWTNHADGRWAVCHCEASDTLWLAVSREDLQVLSSPLAPSHRTNKWYWVPTHQLRGMVPGLQEDTTA